MEIRLILISVCLIIDVLALLTSRLQVEKDEA